MIIESLLDTDLYKFTMGQVALHQFPWVNVEYEFKCRNQADWTKEDLDLIDSNLDRFSNLRFNEDELFYLRNIRFFKDSYIDFLRLYQPDRHHCHAYLEDGELRIKIKGPWFLTVYWEVPALAIVNEVYFRRHELDGKRQAAGLFALDQKLAINQKTPFSFVDFGTRRRFSRAWHRQIIEYLKKHSPGFAGTSNVMFAKEFNLRPIGTMAHEFFQVGQALDVPLVDSQKRMLQAWVNEYRGDLGIALTDIVGFDAFLKDFDLYFAKLYDGLRHDSGDPFVWANKAIEHYNALGIDPKTKALVFSDGLTFQKAADLHNEFVEQTNVSFGIGTNLTNDLAGVNPLQIVIKIVECNGRPVAKISDSPGKGMCRDPEYVKYLKKVFGINES